MLDFGKLAKYIPENLKTRFNQALSEETKNTLAMRAFGLAKVPLLFLTSPRVARINAEGCEIVIPFRKIVKNHLGSMYFGAITMGAEASVGVLAMNKILASKKNISLIFKDFQINFTKRAETDTRFICADGKAIDQLVAETIATGERVNGQMKGKVFCLDQEVAHFTITLSLKCLPPLSK